MSEGNENNNPGQPQSAAGQVAQAVSDLFKAIMSGMPPGRVGVICRFIVIFEVLVTLFGIVAMSRGEPRDIVWGCLLAMVAFAVVLIFAYGTPADAALSVGQEVRAQQILGAGK